MSRDLQASGGMLLDESNHVISIPIAVIRDGGLGAISWNKEDGGESLRNDKG